MWKNRIQSSKDFLYVRITLSTVFCNSIGASAIACSVDIGFWRIRKILMTPNSFRLSACFTVLAMYLHHHLPSEFYLFQRQASQREHLAP